MQPYHFVLLLFAITLLHGLFRAFYEAGMEIGYIASKPIYDPSFDFVVDLKKATKVLKGFALAVDDAGVRMSEFHDVTDGFIGIAEADADQGEFVKIKVGGGIS